MRVLVLGKIWPEPVSSAAGVRTMELLRTFLSAGWKTTFATAAQASPYASNLEALGVECHQIEVNNSAFDEWVQRLAPDLVLFDRFMIEEQFGWRVEKSCPDAMRVIDTSDLHSLREARWRQLKEGGELNLSNEVALREIAAIFRSDLSLIISEYEMDLLETVYQVPASQLSYLPLMLPDPDEVSPDFESRKNFVMLGNYLHAPNWDAVQWCCREIWPLIRKQLPMAELHIFGAYEPEKARNLRNESGGVFMLGRAENALETLRKYRVNLAPLRFGAGQKGKVADGFLTGTPTVATPIAAESMNGSIDWGCPVEAEAVSFAETAVSVYENRDLWQKVRRQGFAIARDRLSAEKWRPVLIERFERLVKTGAEDRKKHFIGKMLRHHQHRSTEFMSRWIEEKKRNNSA